MLPGRLTALAESFVTPLGAATILAELNTGPMHVFSSAAGDALNANNFADEQLHLHARDACHRGAAQGKWPGRRSCDTQTVKLATPVNPPGDQNVAAEYRFDYVSNHRLHPSRSAQRGVDADPRGGELGDRQNGVGAADINNVRTVSGGLRR